MSAAPSFVPARKTEINQGVEIGIGQCEHVAPAAAITAVWSTELLVLFVPERNATGTTIAGGDVDESLINEFHDGSIRSLLPQRVGRRSGKK